MTDRPRPAAGALEVVGVDASGAALVLRDPSRPGVAHLLPIDARLRAAVAGDLSAAGQLALGLGEAPSPREIQARMRAGESATDIAHAAGVPLERVSRWEGPVLAERAHLLERALATPLTQGGTGLGDAVAAHLRMIGVDPATVTWTVLREPDTDPVVYAARPGRSGRWSFSAAARRLTPLDGGASTLLDDPPPATPRRLRPAPVPSSPALPVEVEGLLPVDPAALDPTAPGPTALDPTALDPTAGRDPDAPDAEERPAMPGWDAIVRGSRSRRGRGPLDALLDGPEPDQPRP